MKSFIYTSCPDCMELLRVEVDFPSNNKGFTSKHHTCEHCNCKMLVDDKHIYKKGKVVSMVN